MQTAIAIPKLRASMSDNNPAFRIVIADDHALIRGGLAILIKTFDPRTIILECNSFEKVLKTLESSDRVDLLLIDLLMPGMESIESIRHICTKWPEVPVVVVSVREEMQVIRQALRAGAVGYIPKASSPEVTVNAIRLVLSGGIYIPPDALEMRLETKNGAPSKEETSGGPPVPKQAIASNLPLTARQIEVLDLIAEGKSNKEIGDELGLTAGTIKMHLSRIYKVLNAKSRTDALAKYARLTQDMA